MYTTHIGKHQSNSFTLTLTTELYVQPNMHRKDWSLSKTMVISVPGNIACDPITNFPLNGLLGKSNGENPLPIRSNDFQLTNEFSEYFLLKVKRISDMFENIPAYSRFSNFIFNTFR